MLIVLFKGYCILLGAFMFINSYCQDKIKLMQNKRKSYNLLSITYNIEWNQQEQKELEYLMFNKGYSDESQYIRDMLKEVV